MHTAPTGTLTGTAWFGRESENIASSCVHPRRCGSRQDDLSITLTIRRSSGEHALTLRSNIHFDRSIRGPLNCRGYVRCLIGCSGFRGLTFTACRFFVLAVLWVVITGTCFSVHDRVEVKVDSDKAIQLILFAAFNNKR